MANEAQNLGLQQVPETDVRSGGQIASSIASSAASGASAGSVLAPWGTVVGAVVGGGIAAIGQLKGKKREEKLKAEDEQFNEYVERMGDTYGGEFEEQMMVAENGMVKEGSDPGMVEYEDGELHLRPVFGFDGKLRRVETIQQAPKGIKHEDAKGKDARVLIPTEEGLQNPDMPVEIASKEPIRKGDVIVPTQKDKDRFRMLELIDQANKGDDTAKRMLVSEFNSLPSDEEVAEDGTVIGGPLSTSRTEAKEAEESVMLQNMQQEADDKKAKEKAEEEARVKEEELTSEAELYGDWLSLPENEGRKYEPYLPFKSGEGDGKKSGVSFGAGFDLGGRSEDELKSLGASEDTVEKLKPYLGLKGSKADDYLKNNPLELSKEEVDQLENTQLKKSVVKIKEKFGDRWNEMDEGHRKIAMAAYHQYGSNFFKGKAFKQLINNDDEGLIKNLSDWGDKTPGEGDSINKRYSRYVDLIKKDEVVENTTSNDELEEQNS